MDEVIRNKILAALAQVNDPELGKDLVSLDMIRDVKVQDGRATVTAVLVTSASKGREQLETDIRNALDKVQGVTALELAFESLLRDPQQEALPGVKHVITVGSGKGGVGKSTVAANLAASLALEGASVGLLDADIYGPSQSKMFGVEGSRLLADEDKRILPLSSHGVRIISDRKST